MPASDSGASEPKKRRPTLVDVATAAHVSRTTASAALSGTGRIHNETRLHVKAVAAKLGYRPNRNARSLRAGGNQLVATVLHQMPTGESERTPKAFWQRAIYSLTTELTQAGIGNVFVSASGVDRITNLPVDALLAVMPPRGADVVPPGLAYGTPVIGVVTYERPELESDVDAMIRADYESAVGDSIDHLVENGAKQLALLTTGQPMAPQVGLSEAFSHACRDRGIRLRLVLRLIAADEVASLLDIGIDAFIVHGDDILDDIRHVITTIQECGRRIPQDVLVMSLAEGIGEDHLSPPVTTLSWCGVKTGAVVAKVVREGLGSGNYVATRLPYELQVRASTTRRG